MDPSIEYEVTPTVFTYGGECLARLPDGRAVFIPYAIPDERILIRLDEEKDRYARGVIQEILSSSPDRIDPRCPHFSDCGGCHYQHLPYKNQLQLKRAVLIDQLQRVGRIDQPQVNEMVPSPSCWNYRNHVQFHMTGSGELGFMRHRTNVVVPIQECHLPEENINQIWPILDIELIPGLDRISLRSGEEGQDVLIVFESSDPHPIEFSVDLPLSAVHQGPAGDVILAGDDFTVIEVKDTPFVVSAGAFFQVNTLMAELMVDHLLEVLPLNTESVLLDIYCGVGLFSVFIAPLVKKVVGIESDPKAGEDFLYNLAGFDNVQLYDVSAESILPELKLSPNIIILDPPRTGISKSVMDSVVKLTPEVIAYVSCDPATLARDAGRLSAKGFYLKESTPFDMFPQTYHIESVNIFQRASSEV